MSDYPQFRRKPRQDTEWQDDAACRSTDPEAFFPVKGGPLSANRAAKRVCHACPVEDECLEYAISHGEWLGIWGGKSERERHVIARLAKRKGSA